MLQPKFIDVTLLLRTLKDRNVKPNYFGLGFIQCKITDDWRVHFYHPDLVVLVGDEEVHDHRYNFVSAVLAGRLQNEVFELDFDRAPTHQVTVDACVAPGALPRLNLEELATLDAAQPKAVALKRAHQQVVNAGEPYYMQHDQLHTVKTDFAITSLVRDTPCKDVARVVVPLGDTKVCPFSAPIDEAHCWKLIEDCIALATK